MMMMMRMLMRYLTRLPFVSMTMRFRLELSPSSPSPMLLLLVVVVDVVVVALKLVGFIEFMLVALSSSSEGSRSKLSAPTLSRMREEDDRRN